MKRNLEIIRELLLIVEELGDPIRSTIGTEEIAKKYFSRKADAAEDEETIHQLNGHIKMAFEAGLITGIEVESMSGPWSIMSARLSPYGHEYVDSVRDPKVWKKSKEIASHVGGVTIGLMIEIAKQEIKNKLGIGLP